MRYSPIATLVDRKISLTLVLFQSNLLVHACNSSINSYSQLVSAYNKNVHPTTPDDFTFCTILLLVFVNKQSQGKTGTMECLHAEKGARINVIGYKGSHS